MYKIAFVVVITFPIESNFFLKFWVLLFFSFGKVTHGHSKQFGAEKLIECKGNISPGQTLDPLSW